MKDDRLARIEALLKHFTECFAEYQTAESWIAIAASVLNDEDYERSCANLRDGLAYRITVLEDQVHEIAHLLAEQAQTVEGRMKAWRDL